MMIESEKWCAFRASVGGLVVYLLGWRVWRAWVGSVLTGWPGWDTSVGGVLKLVYLVRVLAR